MRRNPNVMAIDPSLTCSGWALLTLETGRVRAVGKLRALSASYPLAERLNGLHLQIGELLSALKLGTGDFLICESPTTVRDPHNALKVEQVRGIFESLARSNGICVPGRLNPRTVQFEVMGLRGKQLQRSLV